MAIQIPILELPKEVTQKEVLIKKIDVPLWTDRKAKLIQHYLYLFIQITKHGTYIDGFAGPQNEFESDSWAAKLVIDLEPKWMRNFYLFDLKPSQYECLLKLKNEQSEDKTRTIEVKCGDFNQHLLELFQKRPISEKEATFCLLDQRTFECDWATVEAIAMYEKSNYKIEIFYFLPTAWLDRAVSAVKDKEKVLTTWYGKDWEKFIQLRSFERAEQLCNRFNKELKYNYAHAWPIYEHRGGGRIMYYMIHATDHPEAPKLMRRAYSEVVKHISDEKQTELFPDFT